MNLWFNSKRLLVMAVGLLALSAWRPWPPDAYLYSVGFVVGMYMYGQSLVDAEKAKR
jgi:hypothetical protein